MTLFPIEKEACTGHISRENRVTRQTICLLARGRLPLRRLLNRQYITSVFKYYQITVEAPSHSSLLRPSLPLPSPDEATSTRIVACFADVVTSREGRLFSLQMTVQGTVFYHCQRRMLNACGLTAFGGYGYPPPLELKSERGGCVSPRRRRHIEAVATTTGSSSTSLTYSRMARSRSICAFFFKSITLNAAYET